ncbi:MAG: Hsp20/alpha crystallin family protein [Desulfuromonadales bacterium]|nr:Hsp20/alpha crystallin family protein [Desulfuromonadales bacterium]
MRTWDLFKEMDQLHREIDGLFNGYNRGRLFGPAFEPGLGLRHYPKINLRDDEENVYVEALLPGVDPDKLDMNILGNTLTLAGERAAADPADEKCTWHRRERGIGKFMRTIELPVEIVADKVKAECRNGLLRVTMPKAAEAKPKKISVKVR